MKNGKTVKRQTSNVGVRKKKKVLLVEDDPAIVDIYETMIKKAGFDSEVLKSGEEAMKNIRYFETGEKTKPDMVLLDLVLPDINGAEILEAMRKNKTTKNITVFILTNQEKAQTQDFGDFKPDKVLIKANVTPSQLVEIIKEQLR